MSDLKKQKRRVVRVRGGQPIKPAPAGHSGSSAPVKLSVIGRFQRAAKSFLQWHVPQVVSLCGCPLRELTIIVASDPLIKRLHRQYLHDPTLTDVITFPLEVDERGCAIAGEVYLCISVARREAKLRHIPMYHELLLYAVHGVLHLCGHDDLTPRKRDSMHKEEDRILQALGVGPVFCRSEQGIRRKPRLQSSQKGPTDHHV